MTTALDAVWWIGGSPCSGKSTLARRVVGMIDAQLYVCDDEFDRHAEAVPAGLGPTLKKVSSISAATRLAQPLGVQVDDVFNVYREEWPQIVQDIWSLRGRVVVEGAALLPELLESVSVATDHAVWVVPTESFQRHHYAHRAWAHDLVRDDLEPEAAFDRWMHRDTRFAESVAQQARGLGFPVIVTDHGVSLDDQFAKLLKLLELPQPPFENEH